MRKHLANPDPGRLNAPTCSTREIYPGGDGTASRSYGGDPGKLAIRGRAPWRTNRTWIWYFADDLEAYLQEERKNAAERRGPWWHYRFTIAGQEFAGSTDLRATRRTEKAAERFEKHQRQLVLSGRAVGAHQRFFATVAVSSYHGARTLNTAKTEHAARIETQLRFPPGVFRHDLQCRNWGRRARTLQDTQNSSEWRRDVTLRHDLHA